MEAEWSTAVVQDHDVATPALLCHKEPELVGGFGCDELVLYGIRELA